MKGGEAGHSPSRRYRTASNPLVMAEGMPLNDSVGIAWYPAMKRLRMGVSTNFLLPSPVVSE
ncbi:MAG: hypothetical protein SWK76_17770 [Actinomycetota bacterium]|nr:hypothetical protein [Actinomycetota bacterium]